MISNVQIPETKGKHKRVWLHIWLQHKNNCFRQCFSLRGVEGAIVVVVMKILT